MYTKKIVRGCAMYRRRYKSLLIFADFILVDLVCMNIALTLSYIFRHGMVNPYLNDVFINNLIILTLLNLLVYVFTDHFDDIKKRGYYKEFVKVAKHVIIVMLFLITYLFIMKTSNIYSRMVLLLTTALYIALSYIGRIIWKAYFMDSIGKLKVKPLLIVTNEKDASKCIESISCDNEKCKLIPSFIVIDKDMVGNIINGAMVVGGLDNLLEYVQRSWVDAIFLNVPVSSIPQNIMDGLNQIGVVIHTKISEESSIDGKKQYVEKIGDYTVLTTSMNFVSTRQLFLKRMMDIVGGLVGCIITGILFIFIAPIIKIKDPGSVFFAQERVGQNGRVFKVYKFRTMYLDAEERKAELMKKNKIAGGLMFKMDDDPRIIGSKILPDGTYKKGFGNFLRDYSLDEFPQFWSCLKGDMSLVGTRPPTINEVDRYACHHHARLATKPGITGMWQVNGRSNITDFEEVVRLDTQYINEWDIGMDLRILLKTFMVVLKREGSM